MSNNAGYDDEGNYYHYRLEALSYYTTFNMTVGDESFYVTTTHVFT